MLEVRGGDFNMTSQKERQAKIAFNAWSDYIEGKIGEKKLDTILKANGFPEGVPDAE